VLGIRKSLTSAAKDDFWKVRKAGFSLLMAMVGDAKPIAFVEDTAVSPDRSPRFTSVFKLWSSVMACERRATACDVGCLHIRPIINVKTLKACDVAVDRREISDLWSSSAVR